MTTAAKEAAYFLNTRPLGFLSVLFSLRDVFMGIGLSFNRPDLTRSILYHNLDALGSARIYGIILIVVGVFTAVMALRERTKLAKFGLRVMSWFWLFACFCYFLNGNYLLSLVWLCCASLPAGYIAFYYKYNPMWDGPKNEWRERYGLRPLDTGSRVP